MLILGDISGIQDFLFDIRETGGKQASTLRFRSLRLQLVVEAIARKVLWTFDLPVRERLLYCAAGKFAIDATGAAAVASQLDSIRLDIEKWLLQNTHGRLRCAIIADDSPGTAAERNDLGNAKLQRAKLRPWISASWTQESFIVPTIFDLAAENDLDANLGRQLVDANVNAIELSGQSVDHANSYAGVSVRFSPQTSAPPGKGRSLIALDRIARHTPRDDRQKIIEFVDLAQRSRGAPMLGVLKADADSLGSAIRAKLGNAKAFDPLRQFSQKLDGFFGQTLDREMSANGSRWNSIYTIFAGGDDLLLVGPWDIIIDFAAHVREKFMREFNADGLTLSAGCAIVKPKFPIHLAAQQAEELLEHAKDGTKDQFAVMGDVWKWSDHAMIIDTGKQLADWVDASDIQRGWLHTLLELALLRRQKAPPRDAKIIPAMATSRLSYHVDRNWPKPNAPGEKGQARRWIDNVLSHFDNFEKTTDPITIHLPPIIRYAMLATRGKGDDE